MTRKDYVLIAQALKAHAPEVSAYTQYADGFNTAHAKIAAKLADSLARDNPRFDRARFLEACGVGNA